MSVNEAAAAEEAEMALATLSIKEALQNALDAVAVRHTSLSRADIIKSLDAAVELLHKTYKHKIDPDAVAEAQAEVAALELRAVSPSKRKPVRVYIDGCFDVMHAGHYNALRQAKSLGDILVVGVHSDEEIMRNKGPPVMNDEERKSIVAACKWVDEVAFGTPYVPSVALLDELKCDFVVHGDDMATSPDGVDVYAEVKQAGRMRIVKRSTGISTTDLVGRLLLLTKDHHVDDISSITSANDMKKAENTAKSSFLTTTWRLSEFANKRRPKAGDKIVYVDGVFDLFHIGHVRLLEEARKLGDFLYVGVHDDKSVNSKRGANHPIMNLHERVLNVLSCRYVDDVVVGAPWSPNKDLLVTLGINFVVCGSRCKLHESSDTYEEAKAAGVYVGIWPEEKGGSESDHPFLSTDDVIQRVIENHQKFMARNSKKSTKEKDYYAKDKVYVPEV
eukprot:TRINITY_DN5130_c0_g1_i1.p1 TRINITY_DN5130_c0_g1~~TRINITY_DN5130_c0_g1_i1.p1  ORF type:complete len:457 (-),score=133.28 TRINITY_DN5130_c0_g1_i1:47-1387(-)